jgi:hypothetical protein
MANLYNVNFFQLPIKMGINVGPKYTYIFHMGTTFTNSFHLPKYIQIGIFGLKKY